MICDGQVRTFANCEPPHIYLLGSLAFCAEHLASSTSAIDKANPRKQGLSGEKLKEAKLSNEPAVRGLASVSHSRRTAAMLLDTSDHVDSNMEKPLHRL